MATPLRITRFTPADCGGSYLAFATPDEATFYRIVAAIKTLGYAHAQWTPDVKAWWLSPTGLAKLCGREQELARLIGDYLCASGGSGGAGGAGGKRQRSRAGGTRKQTQKANASAVPADVATALATLYLAPDAPTAVVKAVYRTLAKGAHPDVGGDQERMKALNASYERAMIWAQEHGARFPPLAASA